MKELEISEKLTLKLNSINRSLIWSIFAVSLILMLGSCEAPQNTSAKVIQAEFNASGQNMYVIERNVPGAGKLTAEELQSISQTSCGVLDEMGSEIKWMHSYISGDKIYCVYTAPNEEMVREHAKQGGFPADVVNKVETVIDPSTAE